MTNVGFIGLGDQGAPMARAVADGGYELHVWVRRPASLTALEGTSYTAHDSVASLASAVDVLLLCLRDDDDIADLLDVDVPALIRAISTSSGASFVLGALESETTPEVAPHLQGLMGKDIEHFAAAVRKHGIDPGELYARGGGWSAHHPPSEEETG